MRPRVGARQRDARTRRHERSRAGRGHAIDRFRRRLGEVTERIRCHLQMNDRALEIELGRSRARARRRVLRRGPVETRATRNRVLLGREQRDHEFLYWEFFEGGFQQAVRWGDWKAVRPGLGDEQKVDLLCELNVREQVANVCETSIVQNAWKRGADLSVHGWIYDIKNGILKDLDTCVTSTEELESHLQHD